MIALGIWCEASENWRDGDEKSNVIGDGVSCLDIC